jgi:hypothetical protein
MAGYNSLQDNPDAVLTSFHSSFLLYRTRARYGSSDLVDGFYRGLGNSHANSGTFFTFNAGIWYSDIEYRIYAFWWFVCNCVSVARVLVSGSVAPGNVDCDGIIVSNILILALASKVRQGTHILAPHCTLIFGMANSIFWVILRFVSEGMI